MAHMLRLAARETSQKIYVDKFNRAADELEHRARCLAGTPDDARDAFDIDETLHAPVDIRI